MRDRPPLRLLLFGSGVHPARQERPAPGRACRPSVLRKHAEPGRSCTSASGHVNSRRAAVTTARSDAAIRSHTPPPLQWVPRRHARRRSDRDHGQRADGQRAHLVEDRVALRKRARGDRCFDQMRRRVAVVWPPPSPPGQRPRAQSASRRREPRSRATGPREEQRRRISVRTTGSQTPARRSRAATPARCASPSRSTGRPRVPAGCRTPAAHLHAQEPVGRQRACERRLPGRRPRGDSPVTADWSTGASNRAPCHPPGSARRAGPGSSPEASVAGSTRPRRRPASAPPGAASTHASITARASGRAAFFEDPSHLEEQGSVSR